MLTQVDTGELVCMFCGESVEDFGEAYYDHLQGTPACREAWKEWTDDLNADWGGGD